MSTNPRRRIRTLQPKKRRSITRFMFVVLSAFALALFLRHFVVDIIAVTSSSMAPTINIGTRYLMEKVSFRFRKPTRNDIVAFPSPVRNGRNLVKRVVAVGGETVRIANKAVFVNGTRLTENFAYHSRDTILLVGDNLGPLDVPEGMVFVMGDNRDESEDSRDWIDVATGNHIYFVRMRDILGRIALLY
jgi:signal peptidase I